MAEPFADWVVAKIGQAAGLYHRLIIVVAPAEGGKTVALREVCERTGFPLINLNLDLSSKMLDLTERQRVLQLPRLLSKEGALGCQIRGGRPQLRENLIKAP